MAKNELPQGLLASIRSGARGGEVGRPMEIPLDTIDPDPDQPRRAIDPVAISELAETMLIAGVIQPIMVRKSQTAGRWVIVVGERRWRAAKLAGLKTIPALESKDWEPADRAQRQVIENQHRVSLSNTDIARAVEGMTASKITAKQIAIVCNIHEQQVKIYRAISRLPESLAKWADRLDVRTVYELHLAWQKADGEGRGVIQRRLDAVEDHGTLTLTDARRVIKSLGSVPTVRKSGENPGTEADSETALAVPRNDMVIESAGGLHLHQADNALAGAGRVVDRNGVGQGARLRELVSTLADALHNAANALDPVDRVMADGLRRQADRARDEVDGRRIGSPDDSD